MSESMMAMLLGVSLISTGIALIATCVAIAAARSARSSAKKLKAMQAPVRSQRTVALKHRRPVRPASESVAS